MKQWRGTQWVSLVTLAVMFVAATYVQAQDNLFAGAEKFARGAKDTTEVNLDKNMMGLASKFSGQTANKKEMDLAKKMDFVYVRSYEYAKAGQYNMADVEKIAKRLDGGGWSHVVKERSATESTDVCMKTDDEGQLSEMVVISAEPMELTFVHLKGHMPLNELSKLGSNYGAPQGDATLKTRPK